MERFEAVEDLVRNQGFFTEKMLHVEASRVAQVHADHLAYSMAASTLGRPACRRCSRSCVPNSTSWATTRPS